MPVNQTSYQNGKIYKIWSLETDKIYIGSTCDTLTNRMCRHRSNYKRWEEGRGVNNITNSVVLFDLVGLENCKIELIHNFPCESKSELEAEEGLVMRANKDLIVNRQIPNRSKVEYYVEYCDKHKEQIKIKGKAYRDSHKEQIKEYIKEYQKEHKEQIKIKRKEYYDTQKQKMTCECGSIHTLKSRLRHIKTKKHQDFIKPQ